MSNLNKNLKNARNNKEDEFYTQLSEIEKEIKDYRHHFKDKVVYCNADDPRVSNFYKYFAINFESLGLKKLIASCYVDDELSLFSCDQKRLSGYYYEYTGGKDEVIIPTLEDVTYFKGNGDFRSVESIELLKQADVVVTNPPFSLFRDHIAQIIEYEKEFLVIGNINAITYKETFKLLKDNKVGLGINNGYMAFRVPDHYTPRKTGYWEDELGQKWRSMGNIGWYTNLDVSRRHEKLILYKKYTPEEYPKYNNYNIINVDKVADIPVDYEGIMGVPITFMHKHNPDQFEILGIANSERWTGHECFTIIGDRKVYNRILIKNKEVKK